MNFIIFFLVLIVPGLIAAFVYNFIACDRKNEIIAGLIFDLLIFIIMITGLFFFKDIITVYALSVYFNYFSFMIKYALLSTFIGIVLGVIFGYIGKIFKWLSFNKH